MWNDPCHIATTGLISQLPPYIAHMQRVMSEKTELMEGQLWSLAQPDIRTNIRRMKLIFIRLKAQCFNEGGFTGSYKGLPEVGILKGFWDVQGVLESRKQTGIYNLLLHQFLHCALRCLQQNPTSVQLIWVSKLTQLLLLMLMKSPSSSGTTCDS